MALLTVLRRWRESAIGALLIALALLWFGKNAAERHVRDIEGRLRDAAATLAREREEVRSRTALAKAEDAARAARVERDQSRVSQEVSNDFQKQLADLRRRDDALRLSRRAAAADSGGGGGAPVPGLPDAARGADGPAGQDGLPAADALIASEQALRLKALQDWVRGQAGIER
ncbi:MAG: hypothetical protein ACM3YM_08290 [Sphingomonadales bacterium]